jgi:hypothetical protein
MKKLITYFLGTIFVLALLFCFIGLISNKNYTGTKSSILEEKIDRVWAILINIEEFAKTRPEIISVEILERDEKGNLKKWKEKTDMDGYALFEVINSEDKKSMEIKMTESSFGISGIWKYELEKLSDSKTKITVSENSLTENFYIRTILTIFGRDSNLKQEIDNFHKSIKK